MTLRETRTSFNLSQKEASSIIGIPVRTFRRYELDENHGSALMRQSFISILKEKCEISEKTGLLTIDVIREGLKTLLDNQYEGEVDFCYLFGSYAKGYATETSDVDLCVSTSLTGMRVAGLAEAIRGVLHKKIDLIRLDALKGNLELIGEILKDGVKVYPPTNN